MQLIRRNTDCDNLLAFPVSGKQTQCLEGRNVATSGFKGKGPVRMAGVERRSSTHKSASKADKYTLPQLDSKAHTDAWD